ncbi:hypothetical protein D7X33_07365 [Butyricicoccus sp. 1XD8-22]|nr:hypothetical protein D7X33_07365 [Butyricicoccus sp. 1XD8-22]
MTLDLKYIMENLDAIVGFFTPASAFMVIYRLYAHYAKKMALFSAETVIYSFLINMVANILYPGISFVVLHIICLVLGGFFGYIKNLPSTELWLRHKFNKVYDDDLWYGISDFEHGCFVEVFLKDSSKSYQGVLKDDYMHGDSTWITISGFTEYNNGKANPNKSFTKDQTRHIALNTDDIARVEIRYSKNSVKVK